MVKMGNVWEHTQEVLGGRGGMLAGIAALTLFVPAIVGAGFKAYAPPSAGMTMVAVVITIVTTVLALYGQLAIIAASTDPATDRAAAFAAARSRLGAGLIVAIVLAVAMAVVFLPAVFLVFRAGFNLSAMASGVQSAPTNPGAAALGGGYVVILGLALLFLGGRLVPLYAIVLRERLSVGAIARCWRLTRRHTWRLFGAVMLFGVVLLIATWAAQSVVGLIARLALGPDQLATVGFLAAVAGQAVSAALSLFAIVFSAQAYVAFVAREQTIAARAAERAGA